MCIVFPSTNQVPGTLLPVNCPFNCRHTVGRLLTAKVRLLFQNIEDRSQPSAAVRVARKLYEFVLRAPESSARIDIEMGQEQFGQLVSLSRQKTNQQLKYLESQQVIALEYGKISIISMSKLKRFAQIS